MVKIETLDKGWWEQIYAVPNKPDAFRPLWDSSEAMSNDWSQAEHKSYVQKCRELTSSSSTALWFNQNWMLHWVNGLYIGHCNVARERLDVTLYCDVIKSCCHRYSLTGQKDWLVPVIMWLLWSDDRSCDWMGLHRGFISVSSLGRKLTPKLHEMSGS